MHSRAVIWTVTAGIFFSTWGGAEMKTPVSDGHEAVLANLPKPVQGAVGYPDRSPDLDVLPGFKSPPPGYGNIPFYWWNGDKLDRDRLLWQLEILQKANVQGFAVSYIHSHPQADPELNRNGYAAYGMTVPGDPPVFSDEWWEIWNWFSGECAKRGIGLGLDDYTFNWLGNKQWPDEIAALPKMKEYRGRLRISDPVEVKGGTLHQIDVPNPKDILAVMAYPKTENGLDVGKSIDLLPLAENGAIRWTAPPGNDWSVIRLGLCTDQAFMLHPDHGAELVKRYFQRFEDRLDPNGRKGMNFFFQDELGIPLYGGRSATWAEDFREEFRKRKGYDVVPYLPALAMDIGPTTPKVRLDYCDVMMDLVEERYFRPIFDWHWERGLIYGCDNNGRGLVPLEYGDYFRALRWFQAPGNDAPAGGLSFIQTKVSGSIAHLYERPRVWLEAFHSMGWGAYPDHLTEQLDRHFMFGGNLLCMHGLYYSTYGGWWEWAPPCFHFRMPYWPHTILWLKYAERLSYLLSQGHHVCDVAIMYPTSPLEAGTSRGPDLAFEVANRLYEAGIDFDFMDYQSLARAKVENGKINVAGENYKVLVLADMTAVRFTTLQKALELFESGGLVVAAGRMPKAGDRIGRDDAEIDRILKRIFGVTATEAKEVKKSECEAGSSGGRGLYMDGDLGELPDRISKEFVPDFKPATSKGKVLHRRVGNRDVYMVMDVPKGEECFFRAEGKVELWDAWTGETTPLNVVRLENEGTVLRIPTEPPRASLIVFSPGEPSIETGPIEPESAVETKTISLDGTWECEIVPTMDNQWGDYRLPASKEMIGPEARQFRYTVEETAGMDWQTTDYDDGTWRVIDCSFGPQFRKLNVPSSVDFAALSKEVLSTQTDGNDLTIGDKTYPWEPYEYSWRWGVQGSPGSQGYHGLKGKLSDDFLIMGEGGHYFFRTFVGIEKENTVRIVTSGREPDVIWLDKFPIKDDEVKLSAGLHDLIVGYAKIEPVGPPDGPHPIDSRSRSAVVLVEEDTKDAAPYPLSMKWHRQPGRLTYDYYGSKPTVGCFRFQAAPGLKSMMFAAYGNVTVWIDGKEQHVSEEATDNDGAREYRVDPAKPIEEMSTVALRIEHEPGYYAGAAFPEPIKLTCDRGQIALGDWSKMGVLKHYSGGMWYRRNVDLPEEIFKGPVVLNLGRVAATCEVHINGTFAGVLLSSPFKIDVTKFAKPGINRIEILVYNTLSNHYQTIPTPYKGDPVSGLLGPVKISCAD